MLFNANSVFFSYLLFASSTERTRGKAASPPPRHIFQQTHQRHKLYRGRTHIPIHPLCRARLREVRTLNKVWLLQVLLVLRESPEISNQSLHHLETPNVHIPVPLICSLHRRQNHLHLRIGNGRERGRKRERRLNPRQHHRHGKQRTQLRMLSLTSRFA